MLSSAPLAERSHSGLVRRFAKPLKGVSSSEGSNPSLSATAVAHVPVAQWIERQVADLKVGGSSPLGHATQLGHTRQMDRSVRRLYPDWPQYAQRLRDAVKDLSADQLALRAGPEHAPIWALAAHVAGTRVFWLCGVFEQPGADATPFPEPMTGIGWEDDEAHPRNAQELVTALDSTWRVIADCLGRWTVDDLELTATRRRNGVEQVHTRASVLNRLFSHEAFHGGEISQLLGLNHLPPIDLWVSPT